jgi:competence protein ComGA
LSYIEESVELLVNKAIYLGASDLHIIPKRENCAIKFRVDGDLYMDSPFPKIKAEKMIAHLKFLAGMDIGERRLPQSGSLNFKLHNGSYYLRLSTLPTRREESLVIRFHPKIIPRELRELVLFESTSAKLKKLINNPHGLIVLCGPTGSGKTTLLYSMLQAVYEMDEKHIVTIEDPIETESDHFTQIEINEKAGITYESITKALLRHNPDIIMIGEIRDAQTAKAAIRASMSGQLVFSTMHANDTASCIERFAEFGLSYFDLQQSLIGVIAQRLVKLQCPFCEKKCHPLCKVHRKLRRSGIVEILAGEALSNVLKQTNQLKYKKLKHELCKGIALGFIPEEAYYRVIGEW